MTITLDGYGSGRNQSAERPFGDLDENRLHAWQFEHRDDNADEANAITAAGAYVMGRNMFGPRCVQQRPPATFGVPQDGPLVRRR